MTIAELGALGKSSEKDSLFSFLTLALCLCSVFYKMEAETV